MTKRRLVVRMNPRKTFAVLVALAGMAVSVARPELQAEDLLTLARDGKTQYTIVYADQAIEPEKKAVQELSDFLGRVTGASFPAVAESALPGTVRAIYVGWTKFAAQNGIDMARLGEEEWVLRSAGENLIITGGRPRGTLYAVYEFLEQQVGCHWLARDTEIVPSRPTLEFPKPSIQAKPSIWMRDIYTTYHTMMPTGEMARRHRDFLVRNKHSVDSHQVYGSPGGCHTFFQYLNARDWFETHPEYFSLVNGKRLPAKDGGGPGQLCLTHPDVRRIVAQRLREFVKRDREKAAKAGTPPPRIYDISQNDAGAAECQCENCQVLAKREGSESGPMIDFINAIADSVKEEYPDILLQTFAYNRTQAPPKTLKPRHNVIVRWCDVYSVVDLVRPLNHPYNSKNYGEIVAWGKIAPHLAIWDYWISYGYYHFPTPYCMIQCIGPDMKLFADMHAETMFCESEEDHEHGENFTALKYWLGYKMMVNPYQPVEPLIETFMAGYFGAAAPRMHQYLKYLQERIDKEAEFLLVRNAPHKLTYLDLDFFRTAEKLFDAAEALVKPESREILHVQRERLVVDGALLYLWPWLDRRLAADERMPLDHEAVIRRYETNWRAQFKAFFSQKAQAVREPKIARLAALFRDPKLPGQFRHLPPRDVADFNWLTFSPYSPGRQQFVADAEAAGGMAAAFAGDGDDAHQKPLSFGVTGGPTITLKPEEVPQDGKYHVFKIGRVRVRKGTTVWAHASRRMGVNVDRLLVAEAKAPSLNDWDAYISLKVKGPDYVKGSTDGNGLWIDRVLLVRPPKDAKANAAGSVDRQPGFVAGEFLYQSAPFPECHASTIAQTNGKLVAAWFGGEREGHSSVGIWMSRHEGGRWTLPVEVANGRQADGPRHPCWNPVLFQPRKGPLLLFYKVGPSPKTWWGMTMTSIDAGKTWSTPQRLPDGILGPIKNKPVELADGAFLSGSSTEDKGWRIHFERSPDGGRTWTSTGPVNEAQQFGLIQPAILVHKDGRLQALSRSRQKRIVQVLSTDGGRTWSAPTPTALPNPNSGIDALTLADGRHLVVYNHTARGRTPLNVAVSADGLSWQAAIVLEREPGEYSYPAVVQTADGLVHITYTWKRQRIKHAVLDPARLVPRDMPGGEWPAQGGE